jgi:hypothetical protein
MLDINSKEVVDLRKSKFERMIFKIPSQADIDGRITGAAGVVVLGRRAKLLATGRNGTVK